MQGTGYTAGIEHFTVQECNELYAILAKVSAHYAVDSHEFYLLTKEMADVRDRM